MRHGSQNAHTQSYLQTPFLFCCLIALLLACTACKRFALPFELPTIALPLTRTPKPFKPPTIPRPPTKYEQPTKPPIPLTPDNSKPYSCDSDGNYARPDHFINQESMHPYTRELLEDNEADIKEIASYLQRITSGGIELKLDDEGKLVNVRNTPLGEIEPAVLRLLQNSPYPLVISGNTQYHFIHFRMAIGNATGGLLYDALKDIGYEGNHTSVDTPIAQRWVERYYAGT